jgi:hypothetical protein
MHKFFVNNGVYERSGGSLCEIVGHDAGHVSMAPCRVDHALPG